MSKKKVILQAATMLFSQKGFSETSMSELSKITGAAGGTIFHHFKNKEDILISILKNVKEQIIEEFDRYFREKKFDTGLDMVEGVITFYLYLAGAMEDEFLLLHRHYPYKLAETNPVCRGHLEAVYNCLTDIFEQAIRLGQTDGSVGDMSARKTALILLSMLDGIVRFKIYNLYDAGSLYNEIIAASRRMLRNGHQERCETEHAENI